MNEDAPRTPGPTPSPSAGPEFRAEGVDVEGAPSGGFLPGILRFFVVPLLLVGASLGIFAGLGALVAQGQPTDADLVATVAAGGKNSRWQAAQELSNRVARGEVDLAQDAVLARTLADAFAAARAAGDDPRVIQLLSVLLGRSRSPAGRAALEAALADGSPDVRVFAVAALAEAADPRSLPALLPRLEDLDGAVRTVAAYAVPVVAERAAPAPPEARAALAKALADPVLDVKWNAALGLARLRDGAGADVVWEMLHRDHLRARLAAGTGEAGAPGATRPPDPEAEDRVIRSALSAAFLLRDRSMADGVKALAATDPSMPVRDWALRTAAALDEEIRAKGPVAQRPWTAAR
jgi:HEAT repeat protein